MGSEGSWAAGQQCRSTRVHTHTHTHTEKLKGPGLGQKGTGLRHSSLGVSAAGGDDKNALMEGPSPALVNYEGLEVQLGGGSGVQQVARMKLSPHLQPN